MLEVQEIIKIHGTWDEITQQPAQASLCGLPLFGSLPGFRDESKSDWEAIPLAVRLFNQLNHVWQASAQGHTRRRSVSPQFLSPYWVTVRVGLDTFVCLSADQKILPFLLRLAFFHPGSHVRQNDASTRISSFCLRLLFGRGPGSHVLFLVLALYVCLSIKSDTYKF